MVSEQLTYFLEQNPSVAKTIIEKSVLAQRARAAARKARDLTRRKTVLDGLSLPGKLADCSRQASGRMRNLYRRGRFCRRLCQGLRETRSTQAILPLRGKILNVEKARLDRIYGNAEIKCHDYGLRNGNS